MKDCGSKKCPFHNIILFSPAKGRKSCWQLDICIFQNAYSFSFQPLLHLADTIIYVHGLGNWKLAPNSVLSAADLICLWFLQCCPYYLAMLCWFAALYKESIRHKKFWMKDVVKLIFPIKHCVFSTTLL